MSNTAIVKHNETHDTQMAEKVMGRMRGRNNDGAVEYQPVSEAGKHFRDIKSMMTGIEITEFNAI